MVSGYMSQCVSLRLSMKGCQAVPRFLWVFPEEARLSAGGMSAANRCADARTAARSAQRGLASIASWNFPQRPDLESELEREKLPRNKCSRSVSIGKTKTGRSRLLFAMKAM